MKKHLRGALFMFLYSFVWFSLSGVVDHASPLPFTIIVFAAFMLGLASELSSRSFVGKTTLLGLLGGFILGTTAQILLFSNYLPSYSFFGVWV